MCYTDKLLRYLEHFEVSCYLRNSSEIFRVNNEYLLYIIVNKSAVRLKKKQARCYKWRVLGKNKLVRIFAWYENAMCFKDISIDDALSQILSYNPAGRLWFLQYDSGDWLL